MSPPQAAELFRDHGALVYRRARRLLGNHADAEEATQEVFIRAIRKRDAFDERSSISTWLYGITTNYCLNRLRDSRRRRELAEEQLRPESLEHPHNPSDMMAVRQLLAAAPDDSWGQAAVCVYVDGMSHQEAAEVLSVSKRTVGNLLDRFRRWAHDYCSQAVEAS